MLMAPNVNGSLSSKSAKENEKKSLEEWEKAHQVISCNGEHWLSPLFLFSARDQKTKKRIKQQKGTASKLQKTK